MKLRSNLVRDITESGFPAEEAAAMVDHNLIGPKQPSVGRSGTYASPHALRILLEQEEPKWLLPTLEGWLSGSQLSRTHFIGGTSHPSRRLELFREIALRDLTASGLSNDDAIVLIEQSLIRESRSPRGPKTLRASPEAVSMMEAKGMIRRKSIDEVGDERDREDSPHRGR